MIKTYSYITTPTIKRRKVSAFEIRLSKQNSNWCNKEVEEQSICEISNNCHCIKTELSLLT